MNWPTPYWKSPCSGLTHARIRNRTLPARRENMKGRILPVLACVVAVLPTPPAAAVTKAQLYEACQAPKKSPSHTFCRAYLMGHFDGFSAGLVGMRPKRFCRPGVLSAEQIWEK